MELVDEFTPAQRATRYPYELWLLGGSQVVSLRVGKDFHAAPSKVAASINAYAKHNGFVAVAYPARSRRGGAYDRLDVWGDPRRPIDEGLPEEIVHKLRRAGRRPAANLLPLSMQT